MMNQTNRFSAFSAATAPIALGKQTVRFAPEMIEYVKRNGYFPVGRDARGDYLHIQIVLPNGAKTASFAESKMEHNPKYLDNLKLYFDGKTAGDGYMLNLTFAEIRKQNKQMENMTAEECMMFLLNKKFDIWLFRYNSHGREYLQCAWSKAQYDKLHPTKKAPKKAKAAVEEELPVDIG